MYLELEIQGEDRTEFDLELLVRLAEEAGVTDIGSFHESDVRAETAAAQQIGVTGVPFFATTECGVVMSGAQPIDAFRAQLDAAVSEAD